MDDAAQQLADSHTAESANASAVAKEAELKAQAAQMALLIQTGLEEFFQRGIEGKRFIPLNDRKMADAERFGFICDDIEEIHKKLEAWDKDRITQTDFQLLKQQSDLTNKIVMGACAFILLAALGAIFALHPIV